MNTALEKFIQSIITFHITFDLNDLLLYIKNTTFINYILFKKYKIYIRVLYLEWFALSGSEEVKLHDRLLGDIWVRKLLF